MEERYSRVFTLEHAPAGAVAEALAEAHARVPAVPVLFLETRGLAEEWTCRFLGVALRELEQRSDAEALLAGSRPREGPHRVRAAYLAAHPSVGRPPASPPYP